MIRKSNFIRLFQKTFKFDKSLKIFKNGNDNAYPETVEDAINNSVTALRCVQIVSDFIVGKGFGDDINKMVVHKEKRTTIFQFLQDVSESIAKHEGVFIHVNYDGNFDIKDMDVLPFMDCRIGKKDDNDYNGKILVSKDWSDGKHSRKAKELDVYNPDKKVVQYQQDKAGGLKKYHGQIFYFRKGKFIYPIAPIHPVLLDASSEHQASIFKNGSLKKGFFGKMLVVTKPMVDDSLADVDATEFRNQESERDEFRKTIKSFIGAENTGGVLHVEMEFESDKIEDEFLIKQIDSNINDKLFAHTEESVASNICAALKVPEILIRQKTNAIFNSSGEALLEAKRFVQEQTEKDRINVEQIINDLLNRFQSPLNDIQIIPLIEEAQNEPDNEN